MVHDATQNMNLTIIGCGKMGQALLKSWINLTNIKKFNILEPYPSDDLKRLVQQCDHISLFSELEMLLQDLHEQGERQMDAIVFALKPQIIPEFLNEYQTLLKNGNYKYSPDIVISIAAGLKLDTFVKFFDRNTSIIRIMPNTPSAIGQGASAYIANNQADQGIHDIVQNLFDQTGLVLRVDDEDQMHAITALSGSGPAYVFAFTEMLAQAGRELGLSDDMALKLARQTVVGAANLMAHEKEMSVEDLRKAVTSKAGTTEAGLMQLMRDEQGLKDLLRDTTLAARQRSIDLSE